MRIRWPLAAYLGLSCAGGLAGAAEAPSAARTVSVEARFAAPVSLSWSNVPLAVALAKMAAAEHIGLVLDRRVDPDQAITFSATREPLETVLRGIAARTGLGYSRLGEVAYLGPPGMARRLRTLAALRLDEVRALPPPRVKKFLLMRTWHWEDLAEPRQLVLDLGAEVGVEVSAAELIPHDLWRAGNLPALLWTDRMTLVLAQFDLTFHLDSAGQRVTIVPAPDNVTITRQYQAGRQAASLAKRWANSLRDARVVAEGDKVRVTGSSEDHEFVEQRLRGTPLARPKVVAGEEVYQLSVESASLAKLIDELAERLGLEFQWDRAAIDQAGVAVDQLVTVKVTNANLDALLRSVLSDTGLTFRREDRKVTIFPALGADQAQ